MRVLAIDYGSKRTGVAVSDPSGTIARPLGIVEDAGSEAGIERILELVRSEDAEQIVVGMPFTLRGEHGAQARETDQFVQALRARVGDVPVETYDERFTTTLGGEDDKAAAHLLASFLQAKGSRS